MSRHINCVGIEWRNGHALESKTGARVRARLGSYARPNTQGHDEAEACRDRKSPS